VALLKELKCCLNERTSRGTLYIAESGLYFYSKMLGETKVALPFVEMQSPQLHNEKIDPTIDFEVSEKQYQLLAFQQSIDAAYEIIENAWNQVQTSGKVHFETPEAGPDSAEDTKEKNAKETVEKSQDLTKKKSASDIIRNQMRERQAKAQKIREESEARIKEKARVTREEKSAGTSQSRTQSMRGDNGPQSLGNLWRFGRALALNFVIVTLLSFVLSSNFYFDSWRGQLAAIVLLASFQVVLCLRSLSGLLVDKISQKVPGIPPFYLTLGVVVLTKGASLVLVNFLVTDMHINGVLAFFTIMLFTNVPHILRLFLPQ